MEREYKKYQELWYCKQTYPAQGGFPERKLWRIADQNPDHFGNVIVFRRDIYKTIASAIEAFRNHSEILCYNKYYKNDDGQKSIFANETELKNR